jgi:hypothetical protein
MTGFLDVSVIEEGGGYQIQRSLRLRSSATAYLNRTFVSAGNAGKFTWSGWVKRGTLPGALYHALFINSNSQAHFGFDGGEHLFLWTNNQAECYLITNSVYRDTTAHLHIVLMYDTTQATASDRAQLWVNGVRVTGFSTETYPALNATASQFNGAAAHYLGHSSNTFDGYLSEVNFIDGQALPPSSFGQTDPVTGQWTAKKYTGTYGTNGFYLDFSDPTSATTLCYDRSGNGNNWTPNNISTTVGATYDSMLDVPLGGGGAERGNYCTWSPINYSATVGAPTDGNLKGFGDAGTSNWRGNMSTFPVDASGNWWAEFTLSFGGSSGATIGIVPPMSIAGLTAIDLPIQTGVLSYRDNGVKIAGPGSIAGSAYGASYASGDVIGINLSAGVLTFYKQTGGTGSFVSQGSAFTGLTGLYNFVMSIYGSSANYWIANFGQRPFNNTSLPTGAKAIHTGNLTSTTVTVSGSFTGNLSTNGPFIWCNGTPETLTINGNAVTFGTHADRLANGFKLRSSSTSYNASGTNTWTATVLSPSTKSAFKYQLAKGN